MSTGPQLDNLSLTVQDLSNIKSIIDIASQRGAFRPNEMAQVGTTYDKLELFLAEITKRHATQNTDEDTVTNSTTDGE